MAVFRIEKTKDFTIMSNHHLRNKYLSLKAKGLQSLMISLPDIWNYSLKGLAKISKDGVESIGTAFGELIGLFLETQIIKLCLGIMAIVIFIIVWGRMIEIPSLWR